MSDRSPPAADPNNPAPKKQVRSTNHGLVRLLSGDYLGVEGRPVEVQVDVSRRSPGFHLVGLAGKSTRESKERIQTALQNCGFYFPSDERVIINLAPAFRKKNGAVFDLPIALGILISTGQVRCPDPDALASFGFLGELGLQGELRPVPGALLVASALRKRRVSSVIVPGENAHEVSVAPGVTVFAARDLHEVVAALNGAQDPWVAPPARPRQSGSGDQLDFSEVRGQETTKRGVLLGAAGGHPILLSGPPGVGKTMLARRIPGILPPLSFEESLEVMRIYSARGLKAARALSGQRPFRAPHHTISYAGLAGGGTPPLPGEISLAHLGVLFLDELPEFQRSVLETLRQPLESGHISIVRSGDSVVFPARFMIVAAMNPCPCGYSGHERIECTCSPSRIARYRQRISGPLIDRIDILCEVVPPSPREVLSMNPAAQLRGLSTAQLRESVLVAYRRQRDRWGGPTLNGQLPPERVLKDGNVSRESRRTLEREAERRALSARAMGRVVRLGRTLADLEEVKGVGEKHILEALAYHRPEISPHSMG